MKKLKNIENIQHALLILTIFSLIIFLFHCSAKNEEITEVINPFSEPIREKNYETISKTTKTDKKNPLTDTITNRRSSLAGFYPYIAFFPLAFFSLSLITQILSFSWWKLTLSKTTWILLIGGFLSTLVITLFAILPVFRLPLSIENIFHRHILLFEITAWLSGMTLFLKTLTLFWKSNRWLVFLTLVFLIGTTYTVSLTSYYGTVLTYTHGVGIQDKFIKKN